MPEFSSEIKKLPKSPGVYLFKNKGNGVIYVGKALSLKARVSQYFQRSPKDPKIEQMISQVASFDYIVVNSEFEALLLEAQLIKQYRPKYNSQLKDDKQYLYIAIKKIPFPSLQIVRRPEIESNISNWYGPFPAGKDAKLVLRTLRKIFPFCTANKSPRSSCLDYHINLCPGICFKKAPEYSKNISKIKMILSGKMPSVVKGLERQMAKLANNLNFEEAQTIKTQLQAIQYVTQGWKNIPVEKIDTKVALQKIREVLIKNAGLAPNTLNRIEGYDISNLGKGIIVGASVTFQDGMPEKGLYRKFKINLNIGSRESRKNLLDQNDSEAIRQVLQRRLSHPEWLYPQLILVDGGKPQVSAAFKAIKARKLDGQIPVIGLAKREEITIIPKVRAHQIVGWHQLKATRRSAGLQLLQRIRDEAHRFAQGYYKTLHRKKTFASS